MEHCRRQQGFDCKGCEVAQEVAENVISKPQSPVVESILEVTGSRCPEGTRFYFSGDMKDLLPVRDKIIELTNNNGQLGRNSEILAIKEAIL